MDEVPLSIQTVYADLVDRAFNDAFAEDFSTNGTFVSKTRNGRKYWYFQFNDVQGRPQKYVGPETPDLLDRIKEHRRSTGDVRQRRSIVSSLHNSMRFPRPDDQVGALLEALSKAGVFRLRAVLVGTVAYQTYAATLGVRLPIRTVMSVDIDIAQFRDISIAVEDSIPPILDVLQSVDTTFRAVPDIDPRRSTRYQARSGLRLDFLTPNAGPDSDEPQHLDALQTDADQLRFLDFLIANPIRAVVLHGGGVPVLVPSPQRYAIHKLILARRRHKDSPKIDKDLSQASALIEVLAQRRPYDLKDAWNEAWGRGSKWQQYLGEGLGMIQPTVRDVLLKVVGAPRHVVPDLAISFLGGRAGHDFARDVVTFPGEAVGQRVICSISREALVDDFGASSGAAPDQIAAFQKHRRAIEEIATKKYLRGPIDEPNAVLVKSGDLRNCLYAPSVDTLRKDSVRG